MNMKRLSMLAVVPLLFASMQAMAADGTQVSTGTTDTVVPVLVWVNSDGAVIRVKPAVRLQSNAQQLLRQTIDQIVTQPAHDAAGKAVSSRFLMKLALHTTPTTNGHYTVSFAYASSKPLPAGRWFWCHAQGKVYLANDNVRNAAARCRAIAASGNHANGWKYRRQFAYENPNWKSSGQRNAEVAVKQGERVLAQKRGSASTGATH